MNREYHIINDDASKALAQFRGRADLIVTSPPYADARKRHYDSIDPDEYAAWFATFHEPLAAALKPNGSLVINIKDKSSTACGTATSGRRSGRWSGWAGTRSTIISGISRTRCRVTGRRGCAMRGSIASTSRAPNGPTSISRR